MNGPTILLLSRSARRRSLLRAAGYRVRTAPGGAEPRPRPGEDPRRYAARAARAKWRPCPGLAPDALRLSADTVVAADDRILGKPADPEEAAAMLRLLAGRTHRVYTAVVLGTADGRWLSETAMAVVRLDPLPEPLLHRLAAVGAGYAGAYAIQAEAREVAHLETGDLDTVIGLPMRLLERLRARLESSPEPPNTLADRPER